MPGGRSGLVRGTRGARAASVNELAEVWWQRMRAKPKCDRCGAVTLGEVLDLGISARLGRWWLCDTCVVSLREWLARK